MIYTSASKQPSQEDQLAARDWLRLAWEKAISLIAKNSCEEGSKPSADEILEALDRLIILTGNTGAVVCAAEAYRALKKYPMPACDSHELEGTTWDFFLRLVLAVQAVDIWRSEFYCIALQTLTDNDGTYTNNWWRLRALTYSQLGLPVGTRV